MCGIIREMKQKSKHFQFAKREKNSCQKLRSLTEKLCVHANCCFLIVCFGKVAIVGSLKKDTKADE